MSVLLLSRLFMPGVSAVRHYMELVCLCYVLSAVSHHCAVMQAMSLCSGSQVASFAQVNSSLAQFVQYQWVNAVSPFPLICSDATCFTAALTPSWLCNTHLQPSISKPGTTLNA